MMKFVASILALFMLSGCVPERNTVISDNSPDVREREDYYERCIGQSIHSRDPIPFENRLACVEAVLGKGD